MNYSSRLFHKKYLKYALISVYFLCFIPNIIASKIDTLEVQSTSMSKSISNIIILPNSYDTQHKAFPVIYLLHGAGGNHTDWINQVPNIQKYVDQYNIIIVCPDGDPTSWYFNSPIDKSMKYETYISNELISVVDKKYNTIKDKSKRAITGLSMGGHGAFYLAFKHQNVWGAAGSMSGGLDIRPFPNNWDLAKRLGDYNTNQENWEEHTVTNMIPLLEGGNLKLIFDCGIDDFFYDVNKTFHQKLLKANIPHDYIERPGVHNWDYWSNAIKYQLLYFNDFFKD